MHKAIVLLLLFLHLSHARICDYELNSRIKTIIKQQASNEHWGILALRPAHSADAIVDINRDSLFTPASNTKLLTIPAYLTAGAPLGVAGSLYTSVFFDNNVNFASVVAGGDPTLNTTGLRTAAAALASKATSIDSLVMDNTLFGPIPSYERSWEIEDVDGSGDEPIPIPHPFCINNGNQALVTVRPGTVVGAPVIIEFHDTDLTPCVDVALAATTGLPGSAVTIRSGVTPWWSVIVSITGNMPIDGDSVEVVLPIYDPSLCAGLVMKAELERNGVAVGNITTGKTMGGDHVYTIQSCSILDIVHETLLVSHNLNTETMLRLLAVAAGWKAGEVYQGCEVANMSRILYKFKGTVLSGKVYAKTGTLGGVSALSGYMDVTGDKQNMVVFSILVNNGVDGSADAQRRVIDDIAVTIASSSRMCDDCASNCKAPFGQCYDGFCHCLLHGYIGTDCATPVGTVVLAVVLPVVIFFFMYLWWRRRKVYSAL